MINSKEAVLDTSAIMSLILKYSATDLIENRLYKFDRFHIHDLTYYESFNTIWRRIKKDTISVDDGNTIMDETYSLLSLLKVHSFNEILKGACSLSVNMDITVYDASYVF
ncbi:MAG: type II toxin-antitoxin system VapC family toxin [Ferroplasma sp.]|uniref:type II toxin-antitoxin system VapC family toxin n=1 Tax=Ferroplasma sp. TaxID=2591003 RepID=UPI0028159940|nr:type II toxin-antitoxin system VapC family toxin [Ferroplasma sp.]WMT50549.1 MAG: type II toxin-antitoxin system VapC family toxin [Ferroplasma sp.]